MANDRTLDVDTADGMSVLEAAASIGVSEKTIRRWVASGRLSAIKLGGQYRIARSDLVRARTERGRSELTAIDVRSPDIESDRTRAATGRTIDQADQTPVIPDLAPLASVIERQHETIERQAQENRQLAEAAAVWQFRALQAEERLKALTAGEAETQQEPAVSRQDGPGAAAGADATGEPRSGLRAWWRRLWGGS